MKKTILILAVIFIFLFSGCTNSNAPQTKTENINQKIKGFSLEDFNIETDDQIFFDVYHTMTSCKEGYYFMSGEFLYFIDKNTLQALPLCTKPDCEHTTAYSDCNAYLPYEQYMTQLGLYYYNNNLYILGTDGKMKCQSLYLYKLSKDGTKRERCSQIIDFGSPIEAMRFYFTMHKGVGYICYATDQKAELCSFNIDEKNPKLTKIDEIEGQGAGIYRLQGCDNGITYQYGTFTDEECTNYEGGLKFYSAGKTQKINDKAIHTYIIANGKLYYETSDGTKIYDFDTDKTTDFISENKCNSIMYDGKYFYKYNVMLDDNYTLYVYDKNQKLINTITTSEKCEELLFGDSDYLFKREIESTNGKRTTVMYVIDKSNLTKSAEWQEICRIE